jgi:DNA recombination protein RmuC
MYIYHQIDDTMNDPLTFSLLFLLLGLLIGGLLSWLLTKIRMQTTMVLKEEVNENYVLKNMYDKAEQEIHRYRQELAQRENELKNLAAQLSASYQSSRHLEERLLEQKDEMLRLQEQSRVEFENIANKLLEEKSQKFTQHNHQQIQNILSPLKEKIKTFEEGVEKRFFEETRDRISLKKEIEHLRLLNEQLSQDANNLASALKGDNKTQGDWGEIQLERLLEKAGLQKGIHYESQSSYKDENGQQKRPDFIINLPDDKHLIIDSKVSLVAYDQYFQTSDEAEQQQYLKAHIASIRQHLKDLSSKNYQNLYQINSPDYLMLFIPIEPAFALAVQEDQRLFLDALDKNVVIVTTSTLLATMRTVSYIWKQEKQKRSVMEIARQSGLLYDKFVAFVDDLRQIGQRIEQTQSSYLDAMNKLSDAKRPGDTLIGKAEKIKELGAKASKSLPKELLG